MAPKLTRADVKQLVDVDAEYWKAKTAFDSVKERRSALLAKHQAKLPAGDWVEAFGYRLRRSMWRTGERFSLKGFREAGYKVTAHMRRFISETSYPVLDVRKS